MGLNKIFHLKFTSPPNSKRLHLSNGFFVLGFGPEPNRIVLRPATFVTHPRLTRPPDWPREFCGCRIPVDADVKVTIDAYTTQGWRSAYETAQAVGSVILPVVLTKLPSGDIGIAIAGEEPVIYVKGGMDTSDRTGEHPGGKFLKPKLTAEALKMLRGHWPGDQRPRDLELFKYVPTLAAQPMGPDRPTLAASLSATAATRMIRDDIGVILDADPVFRGADEEDEVCRLARVSDRTLGDAARR